MQVEVWSDVVCPWCYIGKRRLESALEQFPHRDQVEVVWRSFQLDPTRPRGRDAPDAARAGRQVRRQRRATMRANMAPRRGARRRRGPGLPPRRRHQRQHPARPRAAAPRRRARPAQRAQGAPAARLLRGGPLGLRRRLARAVRRRGRPRRGRGPRGAGRPALPGRRPRRTPPPRRRSARPASRSSSSTGSTAPRAPSRPSCCCRSSSAPGPTRNPLVTVPAADGCDDDSCAV